MRRRKWQSGTEKFASGAVSRKAAISTSFKGMLVEKNRPESAKSEGGKPPPHHPWGEAGARTRVAVATRGSEMTKSEDLLRKIKAIQESDVAEARQKQDAARASQKRVHEDRDAALLQWNASNIGGVVNRLNDDLRQDDLHLRFLEENEAGRRRGVVTLELRRQKIGDLAFNVSDKITAKGTDLRTVPRPFEVSLDSPSTSETLKEAILEFIYELRKPLAK
jgi:hypothetical protein